jgi:hypothetical protein
MRLALRRSTLTPDTSILCISIINAVDLIFCLQEIGILAGCRSPFITRYQGSLIPPGSSQLLIIMELLVGSVADAVRGDDDDVIADSTHPLLHPPGGVGDELLAGSASGMQQALKNSGGV